MSKSFSHNSVNSSSQTTISDSWEHIPSVQYGFPEDKGPIRAPKLRTIFERIPDDATTVSPIYILNRDQYNRQQRLSSGYEVKGATSIATELQDECETDNRAKRVLYPVHIESDVYHEEDPATLIGWFREFVEDFLDVPFHTCQLYFSGNRSIHVHVPRFVSGERARERLKELAETFCEETAAELDCGLYYAKRMFRLPGVEHAKTGLQKAEIEPEWEHNRIVREAINTPTEIPESYADVLQQVFVSQESLTVGSVQSPLDDPLELFRVLDSDKTVLEFGAGQQDIETPLIEQEQCPNDVAKDPLWCQYNAKEFSPYALASGGSRSVAVVEVKGSPFSRKEVTGGSYDSPVHALVPVFFFGARGCAGDEYTKNQVHAPLQLSKLDYEKWDYKIGDKVVVIGGKSNQSVIFRVESWQATVTGHALTGPEGNRQDALAYLIDEGYDIGKAGKASFQATQPKSTRKQNTLGKLEETEAAKLQSQAETDGIESLSHRERGQVACRLLLQGWKPAWQWFKAQFGSSFDPNTTREQFLSVINSYPDDYSHVEVPLKS